MKLSRASSTRNRAARSRSSGESRSIRPVAGAVRTACQTWISVAGSNAREMRVQQGLRGVQAAHGFQHLGIFFHRDFVGVFAVKHAQKQLLLELLAHPVAG